MIGTETGAPGQIAKMNRAREVGLDKYLNPAQRRR